MGRTLSTNIEWDDQSFKLKEDVCGLLDDCISCKGRDVIFDTLWDKTYGGQRFRFETYLLLDGRKPGHYNFNLFTLNYEPFYVGEGKLGRHKRSAKLGRQLDKYCLKVARMKEIVESGGVVRPVVIGYYYTKMKAKLIEKKLISTIGPRYLQNSNLYLCEVPLKEADCNVICNPGIITL